MERDALRQALAAAKEGTIINPERIAKGLYWDRAWSLVSGCSYVSEGCVNCWEAHMRGQQANEKIHRRYAGLTTEDGRWNGQIRLLHENMDLPLKVKKPTVRVLWNDLFHPDVPDEFIFKAFSTMANSQWFYGHTFLVLTKRPERMMSIIQAIEADIKQQRIPETLPNGNTRRNLTFTFPLQRIFLGVTAENQRAADERIPVLLQIPAAVRFVSAEPMLGPVDVHRYFRGYCPPGCPERMAETFGFTCPGYCWARDDVGIDWVICGGESGPGARPMHPGWARSLRDQCQAAGVPYFFKQHGEWTQVGECMNESDDNKLYNKSKTRSNVRRVSHAGGQGYHGAGAIYMQKVGKKAAGRLLDGHTWDETPLNGGV